MNVSLDKLTLVLSGSVIYYTNILALSPICIRILRRDIKEAVTSNRNPSTISHRALANGLLHPVQKTVPMSETKELTYAEVAEHSSKKVSVFSGAGRDSIRLSLLIGPLSSYP